MGTSSRRKIPRLEEELDKIKFDENNNINIEEFKKILQKLLFPHGRKSIQYENIINNVGTTNYARAIKKVIDLSNNYKLLGITGLGIPEINKFSFEEQADLISDAIVEFENPELKQAIKDIIYENGINGTFSNTQTVIIEILKKYIERKIQGNLVEEFAERNESFTSRNFYVLLDEVVNGAMKLFVTSNKIDNLIINYQNETYVSSWLMENIPLVIKGCVI